MEPASPSDLGKWTNITKYHFICWENIKKYMTTLSMLGLLNTSMQPHQLYKCITIVQDVDRGGSCLIDDESPEAAALRKLEEETGCKDDVEECSPAVCMDPGLTNCTTYIVTVTINRDDAENVRPKPKPGDGEFAEVISLPKNDLVYSCALALKRANTKPLEVPFLKF
ncbi:unnamed protein product [Nyctereutes procyonoides]|uniref:(raccoon dog) hypothetical protein n=1 Tax=Nyctereutes procyonoides TaxID=34880 RepID=A0A812A0A5_NYCPR|nr:unnamed protein product [Nyctereutes procyonoides]